PASHDASLVRDAEPVRDSRAGGLPVRRVARARGRRASHARFEERAVSATRMEAPAAPQRSWIRRASERLIARPGRSSVLPLAAVVIGLVLAALGMFRGAPAPLAEVPDGYVALVNQKGVLLSDLIAQVENATMKRFDEATPEEKRRVLRSMIDEELLVQR